MARLGSGRGAAGVGGRGGAGRQSATSTTQPPAGERGQGTGAGRGLGRGGGWRHALGRRVLHGEVTVQTQEGVKTLVMARNATALSKDAITVKSSDGVETTFGSTATPASGSATSPPPTPSSRSARTPS